MRHRPAALWCAAVALLASTAGLEAQTVELRGRGDLRTDTMLKRILAEGGYHVFAADTVVEPSDTVDGHVLVVGATVRFENRIRGDLTLIDANVFLRPGAAVTGDVRNIAGGFFPAPTATVGGQVTELRDAPYRAEVGSRGIIVRGTRAPSLVEPAGFRGILPPTYDRVNGLGLHAGVRLLLPRIGPSEPEIAARLDYHAARERGGGTLELGLRTPSGMHTRIGVERVAASRDEWIQGDFANTVQFLVLGQDLRNRHDAERAYAAATAGFPYRTGSASLTARAQIEDARSLPVADPWHAWGDEPVRPNPDIDPGRITSLALEASASWSRPLFEASLGGSMEHALAAANGDFTFTAFEVAGRWTMQALANHTYLLDARVRGPLGNEALPRQRWSGLGGRGTLPTLDDLERTGDHLVFFRSVYSIPLRAIDLPALGKPAVELVHHFGTAWSNDDQDGVASGRRDLAHNLGLRIRFRLAWIMGVFDPEDRGSFRVTAGLARAPLFPWTPREDR